MLPKKYYTKPKDDRFNQTVHFVQYITRRIRYAKHQQKVCKALNLHKNEACYASKVLELKYVIDVFGNQAENLL